VLSYERAIRASAIIWTISPCIFHFPPPHSLNMALIIIYMVRFSESCGELGVSRHVCSDNLTFQQSTLLLYGVSEVKLARLSRG
jgi:hypothetical protein